jgi:hypothetical protein
VIAALLAVAGAVPLAWEGRATVHDGNRTIAIIVQSRVERDGTVISESWPVAEGQAKGLRRMVLHPDGSGTLERGGTVQPLPADLAREEAAQFGFYQQYQVAAGQCAAQTQTGPGSNVIEVHSPGPVPTAFRCEWNRVTNAANWVAGSGRPVRQDFRTVGHWRDAGNSFPRRLLIKRDGRLFFDLRLTRFRIP